MVFLFARPYDASLKGKHAMEAFLATVEKANSRKDAKPPRV
jgi:hypothetical protein